jgi:hypothetical protein
MNLQCPLMKLLKPAVIKKQFRVQVRTSKY